MKFAVASLQLPPQCRLPDVLIKTCLHTLQEIRVHFLEEKPPFKGGEGVAV